VRAVGRKVDSTRKARQLRRDSTDPEQLFWAFVRNKHLGGFRFVRQYPIGPYFADFVCREAWLVVELDGSQHADSRRDLARDRWMNEAGYSELRLWNSEVIENLEGVLQAVQAILEGNPSPGLRYAPATLSRHAGEGKKSGASAPSPNAPEPGTASIPSPARGRGWSEGPGEGLTEKHPPESPDVPTR
jgi:very-short-patch-repair endonuclease